MEVALPRSAGAKAGHASHPVGVPLVGGARLPLAFILFGLAGLATAVGWMVAEPSLLGLPHFHPRVVALVHLWLPGFLLSVCIGALYQLMPVVLGTPLVMSAWKLWSHFGLHAFGVSLLVIAFTSGHYEWAAVGGIFVSLGISLLFVAVLRTFGGAKRRDAAAWCFPIATGWLAATVLFGLVLAFNRRWPWLPLSATDLLRAHAHFGLAGFFLTLLQGTTFQLIPMFTMGTLRRPHLIWTGLLATQAGLLALAPGLAWDQSALIRIGAVIIAAGILCSVVAFLETLQTRRRKTIEPGIKAFILGTGALVVSAMIGVGIAFTSVSHLLVSRWITAYGIVIIPGALSLTVLGMLCKIVPFLVWMRAYGPKVGKQPVPIATALASRGLEHSWLAFHLAGLGLLFIGATLASTTTIMVGGVALAISTGCFLSNMLRVLAHLCGSDTKILSPSGVPARSL